MSLEEARNAAVEAVFALTVMSVFRHICVMLVYVRKISDTGAGGTG